MPPRIRHTPVTILEVVEQLFPFVGELDELSGADATAPDAKTPYDAWPMPEGIGLPVRYEDEAGEDADPGLAVAIELRQPYSTPPRSPFDVFAITAQLLELSGAYHHVVPRFPPTTGMRRPLRKVQLSEADLGDCMSLAAIWREPIADPSDVEQLRERAARLKPVLQLWDKLVGKYGNSAVLLPDPGLEGMDEPPPEWWEMALRLMIISDEASEGVGFEIVLDKDGSEPRDGQSLSGSGLVLTLGKQPLWFMQKLVDELVGSLGGPVASEISYRSGDQDLDPSKKPFDDWWTSLSEAREDVLCVLPKARTAAVGCTLRSLSHHLALLPPRGIASAKWVPSYLIRGNGPAPAPAPSQLNVLLVPFPFTVRAEEFAVTIDPGPTADGWGAFTVRQTWRHGYGGPYRRHHITQMLADFVASLGREAVRKHEADRIDAVIFPELSLDARLYRGLERELPKRMPDLKLMVSGLSIDDSGRHGNYVAVTSMQQPNNVFGTVREKHHRWKLDRAQIEAYGLYGQLDPRRGWWEDIDHLNRRIDFSVFHERSVMAAMICEDLARVDPCQEILRSVGPNLVIALLMDAPQLPTRWPARYATVLAEDPGSSVLTLTSRGLMTHQWLLALENKRQPPPTIDPVIALWRDSDSGIAVPIRCPYDTHGVWIKLWGRPTLDETLDGRRDTSAVGWTLAQCKPLSIPSVDSRFGPLLGTEDQRLRELLSATR